MSNYALQKILGNAWTDPNHYLSSFPTQLLLRVKQVPDASSRVQYIGYALPDTPLSSPRWLIKKLVYDANGFNTDVLFANGEAAFNKIFDSGASEYASFTYSAT